MLNAPPKLAFSLATLIIATGCTQRSDPAPTALPAPVPQKVALSAPVLKSKNIPPQRIPGFRRSFDTALRAPAIMTGDPELDPLLSYLKASFAMVIKDGGRLVIDDTTDVEALHFKQPYERLMQGLLSQASDQVPADMIRDFCEKNRESRAVWPELTRRLPASMVTQAEINAFFSGDFNEGWQRFYAKNPGAHGIITVSRVGLNRDKTLALFYLGEKEAPLLGQGQLHVLKKEGDVWVELPVEIGTTWTS